MPPNPASTEGPSRDENPIQPSSISLPKGGGAIRGMGEKFAANPVTGTGAMTVPIAVSPGRSGFGPQLALSYDSGVGNGPFGFGWSLPLPSITRKTDKGLPKYIDTQESDMILLSGAEDLVPEFKKDDQGDWVMENGRHVLHDEPRTVGGVTYSVRRYRPRIEGLFARIERWTHTEDGVIHWRSISRDNIVTIYGRSGDSRIFNPEDPDPDHPTRIFSWLICETRDDRGNAVLYEYKAEDSKGVDVSLAHEKNRSDQSRSAGRYLKRILYGNRVPLLDDAGLRPPFLSQAQIDGAQWMFEVVFDYGEHDKAAPKPGGSDDWLPRPDPFSAYRAGFEVRTYRLCRRVLMFHHIPDSAVGEKGYDGLVRSTDFHFRETDVASFLVAATQSGYNRDDGGGYLKKSLPPLEFEYSEAVIGQEIRDVNTADMENVPYGADGADHQWIDLDGEGLSGIFTRQGGGWFYKRNESALTRNDRDEYHARFAPVEQVRPVPGGSFPAAGAVQFLDLDGDGRMKAAAFGRPSAGFYERTDDRNWEPFRAFRYLPNLAWDDPNLRFIDLTGDGRADVLLTEDLAVTWYSSLAEKGFGPPARLKTSTDEERGPRVVFADGTQTVFLADLSGDGLTDIARIRNGEVCYWPNLGYGRFGAKVTMDDAPRFDAPDQFDPRRIRLADIDGSGTTDIIYLGRERIRCWFNLAGNGWGPAIEPAGFPPADNVASVAAVDLLGNGTACIVWSSPLPGDSRAPMKYLNLMAGGKPHLLVGVRNNLGAETRVSYAPSTYFYLQDRYAGRPWITKLPFPVHVVERLQTRDLISRNRFVTRYAYHHGYFDGEEREFRGFGMVEQFDTEQFSALIGDDDPPDGDNIDAASHVPPVQTRTWFHTGVYMGREHVSDFFAGLLNAQDTGEYYREPGLSDEEARALLLPDTILPEELTADEAREASRALKGAMLRQEVYAIDGTEKERHPYTVTEQNFTIRTLQPRAENRHAVFFTHAREAVSYHYERNPDDPRIVHTLTLAVDEFGNVLKSAAVGYGRRKSDPELSAQDQAKQAQVFITCTENGVTNPIDAEGNYRTPLSSESRSYELSGLVLPADHGRFTLTETLTAVTGAEPISYERSPATDVLQKRLIEHARIRFRPDDLGVAANDPSALLPTGTMEPLALPGESYKLAFTPGLLDQTYVRNGQKLLPADPADILAGGGPDHGGYVDLDGDGHWWMPSGRIFYSPDGGDTAAQELEYARAHFFLPHRFRDPFHADPTGTETKVRFDDYMLLMAGSRDALGNTIRARNDYRVLAPSRVTDPNGNRAEAAFDTLGMVVGMAMMGKESEPDGQPKGDSLADFAADVLPEELEEFISRPRRPSPDPEESEVTEIVRDLLKNATTRVIYDLDRFQRLSQPPFAATLARETHFHDAGGGQSKIQVSFSYSDGFGREIQKKIQAEPGPAPQRDAGGKIIIGPDGRPVMTAHAVTPRWVGGGWTVFDNKGKPVRRYEPFFTDSHHFEFDVRIGVSPVLFYDPVERVVATLHPDHTWEKVVFDPWRQETWDVNDTVLLDPKTDEDLKSFLLRLPEAEYLPSWYAQRADNGLGAQEKDAANKAAAHADTPSVSHADSLGRTFLIIVDNAAAGKYETRLELDIEGNEREVIDANGRIVMRYDYDMIGNRIYQASMEAGERRMLADAAGNPLYAWDSRDHRLHTAYDALRRPAETFLLEGTTPERIIGRTVYGETRPDPEAFNLRGKVFQVYDQAGVVTNESYDFKGNLLSSRRQLAQAYKAMLDWSAGPDLAPETFTGSTTYDALNRPISATSPDQSVYHPSFNEATLLEKVAVHLRGGPSATPFVADIDYDARGRRMLIEYGNDVGTEYAYDPLTFRLIQIKTVRLTDQARLQDLRYTHDPIGNITRVDDDAQQTTYFGNQVVSPGNDYAYDAIYRLNHAEGREHIGQASRPETTWSDEFRVHLPHPGDGQAMRRYTERYEYDPVGNFQQLVHQAANGTWTRSYAYDEPSLIEPGNNSNRLSSTTVGGNNPETYSYDAHGNMTAMPHLTLMQWDFMDQLQATARQVVNDGTPETTWYVYDAAGRRVRKVTERQNGARKNERIYLGGFEVYREYDGNGAVVTLERETLHVMDDKQRIAMVETRTRGSDGSALQLIRCQFGNHLGSASLELDDAGQIISYEEYYPYGSTSYQAGRSAVEVSLKRYRYTGMERDEETGLSYHTARYYATWLGRWVSCDPIGLKGGVDLYVYAASNPAGLIDPTGADDIPSWYTEVTRETKDDAEIQRRLQNLDAHAQELQKLVDLSGPLMLPSSTGKPEDAYIVEGINLDPDQLKAISREQSLIAHAQGTLISMLKWNQRRREIDPVRELTEQVTGEKWENLSDSAKSYWRMKIGHPEWQVRSNLYLDMTGSILEESQSTDVQIFHGALMGGIMGTAMAPKGGTGKTWQDFLPEANKRLDAAKAKYGDNGLRMQGGGSDTGTGLNNRLIPAHELVTRKITVPPRSRGVTPTIRQYLRAVARRWGFKGSVDAAHANTPHVFTQPGDEVLLRPQSSSINRAEGADIGRAAGARRDLNDPRVPVRPKK